MIEFFAAAATGAVLLTAASHAQKTDLNVSAATAPKASSDTTPMAWPAKPRKPASAAAPATHTIYDAHKGEAANAAKMQPGKGPDKAR
jgi:hypothetical protein